MAYQYDVYLSYVATSPIVDWVRQQFLPFFSAQLSDLLGRPLSVFENSEGILVGDEWLERQSLALAHSRCYLPLLTPAFFTKAHLKQEFAEMMVRERLLGYRTATNPFGLIVPVVLLGMSHFPDKVREIQLFDLSNYMRIGEGYVQFQDAIREFGEGVLHVLENAPPWDSNWTNVSGFLTELSSLLVPQTPRLVMPKRSMDASMANDTPNDKAKLFISYAREDQPKVIDLYEKLKDAGFRPWLDVQDLLPGKDRELEIRKSIRNSRCFLACLSKTSVAKRGYVHRELRMGLDVLAEFPEGEVYLIPVRLDDCELPERIRGIQSADIFMPNGFNKLTAALELL